MSHITEARLESNPRILQSGIIKRATVLLYGVASYAIGAGALVWFILAMGGLAPVSFGPLFLDSLAGAIGVNLALIAIFGIQHSVMARSGFKNWIRRKMPAALERSTYVLASGIVTLLALALWQPLPGVIWSVESSVLALILWAAYAGAWVYLFTATFVTNHFELMGLRQVYLFFRDQPHTALPFTRKLMYRYSRHPMMLGFLIGMWAVPEMTATHFALSAVFSLYIVVGVFFEERDLIKQFGDTYRRYKKDVAAILPGLY